MKMFEQQQNRVRRKKKNGKYYFGGDMHTKHQKYKNIGRQT